MQNGLHNFNKYVVKEHSALPQDKISKVIMLPVHKPFPQPPLMQTSNLFVVILSTSIVYFYFFLFKILTCHIIVNSHCLKLRGSLSFELAEISRKREK